MNTYLIEYKMLWAGKVVREGVETMTAYTEYQAEKSVLELLDTYNKKAEKQISAVVQV